MSSKSPLIDEAPQILGEIERLSTSQRFQNLFAQSHSREILQRLRIPQSSWPRYSDFDEDLHYTAHFLLWRGLQLKAIDGQGNVADEYVKLGCEVLEFLYGQAATGATDKIDQLFNAAIGYYVAGYYARSYVLMRDLDVHRELPQELELIRNFFEKDFSHTRQLISSILLQPEYSDEVLASELRDGSITQDEALERILRGSLNRAFSYAIEFPKTGIRSLLDTARTILEQGTQLALHTGFVDWWWLLYCSRLILDEYDTNSLWTTLGPLKDDDTDGAYTEPYIRVNYARSNRVVELWRSQIAALPQINDENRQSYCIKMPTSAGKTRIAEMAILRFLIDFRNDLTTKCIYVAPFRSLAVEVENSLKESFLPLGIRVSEIYGGFELSPIERLLMDETRVVVATPEKLDVFFRTNPEYLDKIRLVIIDEGHIINLSDRGIHYEFFLQRTLRLLRPKSVRFFFLSAVLPNMDEFSQWITGSSYNVIDKDWRPSRLLVGTLTWERNRARIDYFESDHKPLGHECFVDSFLVSQQLDSSVSRRRKPYPDNMAEVVAETAIRFAQQGTTMIFCPRKGSVEPMARMIKQALKLHSGLKPADNISIPLSTSPNDVNAIQDCILTANEYMGSQNEVASCLENGFVIHHADIPKTVRLKLEDLVRWKAVRLIIASATLAQGVNLPIQTVIVYGLSHGFHQELTPLTFWNICGRAGRGMQENEGQILFAVDRQSKERRQIYGQDRLRQSIIHGYNTYRVMSSLNALLNYLKEAWRDKHGNLDVAKMCMYLADNDISWLSSQTSLAKDWLNTLDQELLAILEEGKTETISPDVIQEIVAGSLAFLQLESSKNSDVGKQELFDFLNARAVHIFKNIPDRAKRKKYYKFGLPLEDCKIVEAHEKELGELLSSARAFQDWNEEERCDYLEKLAEFFLTRIAELSPHKSQAMNCWEVILGMWLRGNTPNEIFQNMEVAKFVDAATEVSTFIEDAFVYKLPRGLNVLASFFADVSEETGFNLPEVVSYFSALVKYGVYDPVASCLLAFNITSRKLSLRLAQLYSEVSLEPRQILSWFLNLEPNDLQSHGFLPDEIDAIESAKKWSSSLRHKQSIQTETVKLQMVVDSQNSANLSEGEVVLIHPHEEVSLRQVAVETLGGEIIGIIELKSPIPPDWYIPHRLCAFLDKKQIIDEKQMQLDIRILMF